MNIIVDTASPYIVHYAGITDNTGNAANWCSNYYMTGKQLVSGVTLPAGFVPGCWTYSGGVFAVATDEQLAADAAAELLRSMVLAFASSDITPYSSGVSEGKTDVGFDINISPIANADSYQVWYGINGSDSYSRLTTPEAGVFRLGGLQVDTAYTFRLRIKTIWGFTDWSADIVKTTDASQAGSFQGAWVNGHVYVIGDEVTYSGSSWYCLLAHTSSGVNVPPTPPTTTNTWWLLRSAGAQGQIKSTVFIRGVNQTTYPTLPTGGSYASPLPTSSPTWSDGIPADNNMPLYASTRIFTSDGLSPQESAWTTVAKIGTPSTGIRTVFSVNGSSWHTTPATGDLYMATQTSVDNGATWGTVTGSVLIKGEQGIKGDTGTPGTSATQYYTYIRYAPTATSATIYATWSSGYDYTGTCVTTSASAPTGYASYTWAYNKGTDGAAPATMYSFTKYATVSSGADMSPTWDATRIYTGIYVGTNSAPAYGLYSWSLNIGSNSVRATGPYSAIGSAASYKGQFYVCNDSIGEHAGETWYSNGSSWGVVSPSVTLVQLNALNITAGSVAAANVTAGVLTGQTYQTQADPGSGTSRQRVTINDATHANQLTVYNGDGTAIATFGANLGGGVIQVDTTVTAGYFYSTCVDSSPVIRIWNKGTTGQTRGLVSDNDSTDIASVALTGNSNGGIGGKFTSNYKGLEVTGGTVVSTLTGGLSISGGLTISSGNMSLASGTVTATTFVGAVTGTASGNLVTNSALGTPVSGNLSSCTNYPAASTTIAGLAPAATAPAATFINVVGIGNGETAYTNKALFDATSPSTQAFADAAAAGTAVVTARRDHKHAMPAAPTTITGSAGSVANALTFTSALNTGDVSGTTFNGSVARTIGYQSIGAAPSAVYPVSQPPNGYILVGNAGGTAFGQVAMSGDATISSTGAITVAKLNGVAEANFARLAGPTFTGTPTLPTGTIATTQTAGNNTTAIATTAFVTAVAALKANLAGSSSQAFVASTLTTSGTTGGVIFPNATATGASATTLSWYEEGSFTGTLTGCTTSPTATIRFVRVGKTVTVTLPTLTGTSSSSGCTITGSPTSLKPATAATAICIIMNGGVRSIGLVTIDITTPVFTLAADLIAGSATFNPSALSKGVYPCSFTYLLT